MPDSLIMLLIAVGAVAFFVVGVSLTLIIKGRHLQSDVGSNTEMKRRGLKCASQQIREEEAALRGEAYPSSADCGLSGCGTCTEACEQAGEKGRTEQ